MKPGRSSRCSAVCVILEAAPPASSEAARELVQRMVKNGMMAKPDELRHIVRYLSETYVR